MIFLNLILELQKIINKIFEIEDRYDSIYNEELRDELRREIEENQEIELEEKIEKMEVQGIGRNLAKKDLLKELEDIIKCLERNS